MALDLTTTGNIAKDRKLQTRAKLLYFANYLPEEISEFLKVNNDDLRMLIFGPDRRGTHEKCWHYMRKQLDPTAIIAFIGAKTDVLEKTAGVALNLLKTNLERLAVSGVELSVDEMTKISKVFIDMDKITRLERGEATEIRKTIGLTPDEARKVLQSDPFAVEPEYEVH